MREFTILLLCFVVVAKCGEQPFDDPKTFCTYRAEFIRNYDGDTLTCNIDLGLGVVLREQVIRLVGINAPEIRGGTPETKANARRAKQFIADRLAKGDTFILQTVSDERGKFGRILATVFVSGKNINKLLLREGLAVPYE